MNPPGQAEKLRMNVPDRILVRGTICSNNNINCDRIISINATCETA
jgi:hypothetical protein